MVPRKKAISAMVRKMLDGGAVFLDTETTGTSRKDEVIELAVLDGSKKPLFVERFKPSLCIKPRAQMIHGIKDADLVNCLPIGFCFDRLSEVFDGRRIFAHNANFDRRLLRQSFEGREFGASSWHCSARAVGMYIGRPARRQIVSLKDSCTELGVVYNAAGHHGAVNDVIMMINVLQAVAAGR